jgi:hypothetical protein
MLINKGFSTGDIVSIKLINGDEIIARFETESTEDVTITRPLALTLGGPGGLGMIPWMFLSAKNEFTLKKSQMFVIVPSKPDAAKQYMEGTTGIALG